VAGEPPYTLEFFEDDDGSEPVLDWISNDLSPTQRRAIGVAMYEILQHEGNGVCGTEFGKALGGGLSEFRLRHDADEIVARGKQGFIRRYVKREKILLRVFFHAHGDKIILLVGGYDKGADASKKRQQKEIELSRNGSSAGERTIDSMGYVPYYLGIGEARRGKERSMATEFADLMKQIEEEAVAEGSDAVAELQAFRTRYQLARELMEARQMKNLTQERLAELSGIGQSEISKIESGRSNPTISTLAAITCALETEIHLIPGGEGRIAAS
jgi:DNA-binding XRE family transcriptional regulator